VLAAGILAIVRAPFLDHPKPIAFAHRGGAAHAPENSWTAFERAIKLGYAYLETDARATSDGKLVAFHDRTLDRVTDASGPLHALSYREVAALRVSGTEPIPLIEDLIAAWPDVRFNIDLKDAPGISLLPEVLRRTGAWDRVCVTSFSGNRLRTARGLLDRPVCMATSPTAIAGVSCNVGTSARRRNITVTVITWLSSSGVGAGDAPCSSERSLPGNGTRSGIGFLPGEFCLWSTAILARYPSQHLPLAQLYFLVVLSVLFAVCP